jgi:2-polyprenyl-3-methyl-5-hydroxy-6-metoxy-1,4-benzoquinol methylase
VALYERFASFYAAGPYPRYSKRMSELLPAVLARLNARPRTLLDVACGEGTFAVAQAAVGLEVTGVDISQQMLEIARRRADSQQVQAAFIQGDMRSLAPAHRYDLVTCWYDSLNYLLKPGDLTATFRGIATALEPRGHFIFDMNTIYGLAVLWRSQPFYLIQDRPEVFEVHVNSYDFDTRIATKRIVGFLNQAGSWERIEEVHAERGYTRDEIGACLAAAGLRATHCWGSFQDMTEPGPETGRVWFVAEREEQPA